MKPDLFHYLKKLITLVANALIASATSAAAVAACSPIAAVLSSLAYLCAAQIAQPIISLKHNRRYQSRQSCVILKKKLRDTFPLFCLFIFLLLVPSK